jgi:two-component system, OmpR family, response regulator
MPKILIVDDDSHIRDLIVFALRKEGFTTVEADDGLRALSAVEREHPDLVVLDILMPELDGTEVCRRIRREGDVPIIFLSSRDDEIDRVLGLELGGDDYVTKPFSPRELVARVKAVLRRRGADAVAASTPDKEISRGPLHLDLDAFVASWDGGQVPLTVTEFAILRTLANHPGKVFTREILMGSAYVDHRFVSDRTIDSHVRRVRAKFKALGGDPIETVHGLGYKLKAL